MSPSKGYLIPETVNPTDNEYIIVSVPAHEGHRRAFWGAMQRLGYWWAWERDTLKQGKDCAARWRDSIAETMELWERIGNLSPLTINVRCGSGGSQVCCDQRLYLIINNDIHLGDGDYDEIVKLPGGGDDDGENPPSPDWPDYTSYQQYKCNYALAFADDLLETLDNYATWVSGFTEWAYDKIALFVTAATASNLIRGLIGPVFTQGGYLERLTGSVLAVADISPLEFITFADAVDLLDRDYIKCIVYNATSAAQAKANLIEMWENAMLDAGWDPVNPIDAYTMYEARAWFGLFVNVINLEPAFDLVGVAETFAGANCQDCGGVPLPISPTLKNNLKMYWKLDESSASVRNDSVNGYHMTPYQPVGTVATGIQGVACSFGGVGTQHLSRIMALVSNNSGWTIAAWFRAPAKTAAIRNLFNWGSGSNATSTCARIRLETNGAVSNIVADQAGVIHTAQVPATSWVINEWNLAIARYDPATSNIIMWVNEGTWIDTFVPDIKQNSEHVAIGAAKSTGGTQGFDPMIGDIDETAVWSRSLTNAECLSLWNNGLGWTYEQIIAA